MIRVRDASMLRVVTAPKVREAGGLRTVAKVRVRDATALREVFSAGSSPTPPGYSASASPDPVTGISASTPVTTGNASVAVVGGTAPYTYAWNLVGADFPANWLATSPTASVSAFRRTSIGPDTSDEAFWTCTVTDVNGYSVNTNTIRATVTRT